MSDECTASTLHGAFLCCTMASGWTVVYSLWAGWTSLKLNQLKLSLKEQQHIHTVGLFGFLQKEDAAQRQVFRASRANIVTAHKLTNLFQRVKRNKHQSHVRHMCG